MASAGFLQEAMADGGDQVSSPPRRGPPRNRERRNPSITPRKFQRFFTPRSRVPAQPSAARRALLELTAPVLNRSQTPSSPLKPLLELSQDDDFIPSYTHSEKPLKRRKVDFTPNQPHVGFVSSRHHPLQVPAQLQFSQTSNVETGLLSPIQSMPSTQSTEAEADLETDALDGELPAELSSPPRRISTLSQRDVAIHVVQREAGASSRTLHRSLAFPVTGTLGWYLLEAHWS
jgi:hypothetical protein